MSFERDIRPLFRRRDRNEMQFAFDLWAYEDVRNSAARILASVEDGTMPCDEPWPEERIQVLRNWIGEGCQP